MSSAWTRLSTPWGRSPRSSHGLTTTLIVNRDFAAATSNQIKVSSGTQTAMSRGANARRLRGHPGQPACIHRPEPRTLNVDLTRLDLGVVTTHYPCPFAKVAETATASQSSTPCRQGSCTSSCVCQNGLAFGENRRRSSIKLCNFAVSVLAFPLAPRPAWVTDGTLRRSPEQLSPDEVSNLRPRNCRRQREPVQRSKTRAGCAESQVVHDPSSGRCRVSVEPETTRVVSRRILRRTRS
jgi:hypothetical protein